MRFRFILTIICLSLLILPAYAEITIEKEGKPSTFIPSILSHDSAYINGMTVPYQVAKGDFMRVRGNILQGDPKYVTVWAFCRGYFFVSPPVKTIQGKYEYVFQAKETGKMGEIVDETEQSFVIVQHPGENGEFDVFLRNNTILVSNDNKTELDIKFYPPLWLKNKLLELSNKTDDDFTEIPFILTQPFMRITDLENIEPTQRTTWDIESMSVRGITNLNMGTPLVIRVDPDFTGRTGVTSFYETELLVLGSDTSWNVISFKIPLRGLTKGVHIFQIYDKRGLTSLSTPFQVYEDHPADVVISTPTPEANITATRTTQIPTITATKTPNQTPLQEKPADYSGFMWLIIIVVIGAVITFWFFNG